MNEYGVAFDIELEDGMNGFQARDLAQKYFNGEGVERDYQKARYYLELAAKYHVANACSLLSMMARTGLAYPEPDLKEALRWMELARYYGLRNEGVEAAIQDLKNRIEEQEKKPVFNVKTRKKF